MQDLWADIPGDMLATEEAGKGGGLRQRRLNEQATLMALRAWLLQEYMLPYGTSLGTARIFQRCYWIDSLGSPGTALQKTSLPSADSTGTTRQRKHKRPQPDPETLPPALQPVVTTGKQLARLARPITLYGFALDKRRVRGKVNNNEVQVNETLSLPKEGGLLTGTWPELAPLLLSTLDQSAAVFLLNPLKDGLFRYADLAPLYQRTPPTELFLWLSHKQIETSLLPLLRTPEGAANLTNLLRSDRWKALLTRIEGNTVPASVIHGLVELFAESMRPHFLSVQRLAFPLRTGLALVEGAPYSLLFATRRQDSLASLNDALCYRERRLVIESQRGVLNEAWFVIQRQEQAAARSNALAQEVLALGRMHRPRRWPDLRQQLLSAHFGQYTLQDYDQVIITLLARGEVRCEWRRPAQEGTQVRVPGSDDLLLWK